MSKSTAIFKLQSCVNRSCTHQSYVPEPNGPLPPCPKCGNKQQFSDNWYIKFYYAGKRNIRSVSPIRKLAERALQAAVAAEFDRKHGVIAHAIASAPLLSEAIEEAYLTKWRHEKSGDKTRRRMVMLMEVIGDKPLDIIDSTDLFLLEQTRPDLKPPSVNRYKAGLKLLLRRAGLPYKFIVMGKENNSRIRVYSPTEEHAIIAAFRDYAHPKRRTYYYEMADFCAVLADTGARTGEVLRICGEHINVANGMISILDNKTNLPRSLPMTPRVMGIAVRRSPSQAERLFPALTEDNIELASKWVRKHLKLDQGANLHAFRHTCCTRLIVAGRPLPEVQMWMGHKVIQTTMRYCHLDPAQLANSMKALSQAALETESKPEIQTIKNPSIINSESKQYASDWII